MAAVLVVIALSTLLNALYYVPAVLSIWGIAPDELKEDVRLHTAPEDRAFDGRFTLAAAALVLGVLALGTLYHPVMDVLDAGLNLLK